jgi:hypothetical protein
MPRHTPLPVPAGRIPMGMSRALNQSGLVSSPLTTSCGRPSPLWKVNVFKLDLNYRYIILDFEKELVQLKSKRKSRKISSTMLQISKSN